MKKKKDCPYMEPGNGKGTMKCRHPKMFEASRGFALMVDEDGLYAPFLTDHRGECCVINCPLLEEICLS